MAIGAVPRSCSSFVLAQHFFSISAPPLGPSKQRVAGLDSPCHELLKTPSQSIIPPFTSLNNRSLLGETCPLLESCPVSKMWRRNIIITSHSSLIAGRWN